MKAVQIINGCKPCPTCKRNLPTEEFHKNSGKRSGYSSWCKDCFNKYKQRQKDRGLCLCGEPLCVRSTVYCLEHLERNNATPKTTRRVGRSIHTEQEKRQLHAICKKRLHSERRQKGLCPKHGNPSIPGFVGCEVCRDTGKQQRAKDYYRLKDDIYKAYGGYVCTCCGETRELFLTLDHINNDGAEHRKQLLQMVATAMIVAVVYPQ